MAAYVRCSAEELKFLWAFQGAIENVMLYKCKHIATSFLEYCADHLQASSAAPVSSVRFFKEKLLQQCHRSSCIRVLRVCVWGMRRVAVWSLRGLPKVASCSKKGGAKGGAGCCLIGPS